MVFDRIVKAIQGPISTPKVIILDTLVYDIVEGVLTIFDRLRRILSCDIERHQIRAEGSDVIVPWRETARADITVRVVDGIG